MDIKDMRRNITMTTLRPLLADIYFGKHSDDVMKYIIPLKGNWTLPTIDPDEPISTWIGYQISSIEPIASRIERGSVLLIPTEFSVRLWGMGKQAEECITSCLVWDYRLDVRKILERYRAKLIQAPRRVGSQIYSQEGFNSELVWLTDVRLLSYYSIDSESVEADGFRFIGCPQIRNLDKDHRIEDNEGVETGKEGYIYKDALKELLEEAMKNSQD